MAKTNSEEYIYHVKHHCRARGIFLRPHALFQRFLLKLSSSITRDRSCLPFLGAPIEVRDASSEIIICIFVSSFGCWASWVQGTPILLSGEFPESCRGRYTCSINNQLMRGADEQSLVPHSNLLTLKPVNGNSSDLLWRPENVPSDSPFTFDILRQFVGGTTEALVLFFTLQRLYLK